MVIGGDRHDIRPALHIQTAVGPETCGGDAAVGADIHTVVDARCHQAGGIVIGPGVLHALGQGSQVHALEIGDQGAVLPDAQPPGTAAVQPDDVGPAVAGRGRRQVIHIRSHHRAVVAHARHLTAAGGIDKRLDIGPPVPLGPGHALRLRGEGHSAVAAQGHTALGGTHRGAQTGKARHLQVGRGGIYLTVPGQAEEGIIRTHGHLGDLHPVFAAEVGPLTEDSAGAGDAEDLTAGADQLPDILPLSHGDLGGIALDARLEHRAVGAQTVDPVGACQLHHIPPAGDLAGAGEEAVHALPANCHPHHRAVGAQTRHQHHIRRCQPQHHRIPDAGPGRHGGIGGQKHALLGQTHGHLLRCPDLHDPGPAGDLALVPVVAAGGSHRAVGPEHRHMAVAHGDLGHTAHQRADINIL